MGDGLKDIAKGCKKGGVVKYETGEPVCSKEGVGAVHGMTVAFGENLVHKDPNEFDIFLVFTGGAQFVYEEAHLQKRRERRPCSSEISSLGHRPLREGGQ